MHPTAFGQVRMPGSWQGEDFLGVKTKVKWLLHHDCWGWRFNRAAIILAKFKLVILPAIIINVRFLLLVVVIASWHWLTQLWVLLHSIGTGSEVFHAPTANEAQVVMAGLQVIFHHALVLPFFSPPQTEGWPTHHHRALGEWIPLKPMILGDFSGWHDPEEADVLGGSLGHMVSSLEVSLTCPHFLHLADLWSCEASRSSHLLEGRGHVLGTFVVIVRVAGLVAHLAALTSSESFEKAFWQLSLRGCHRSPIPPFWVGWPFGSDIQFCCGYFLIRHAVQFLCQLGVLASPNTLGIEAADAHSLPTTPNCKLIANIPKMAASSTLPIRSCKGYINTPWALGRQAHRVTPEASAKAHQSHPSSAVTSCSSATMLSLCICCRTQALFVCHTSTSWIAAEWHTSASLTATVWLTMASLMASMAWPIFTCMVSLAFSTSSLWWGSVEALVVSSHSRAAFICPCS